MKVSEEAKADSSFLNFVNLLAAKHNLRIDHKTSDIKKRQLSFLGGTDEQIEAFIIELSEYIKNRMDNTGWDESKGS